LLVILEYINDARSHERKKYIFVVLHQEESFNFLVCDAVWHGRTNCFLLQGRRVSWPRSQVQAPYHKNNTKILHY